MKRLVMTIIILILLGLAAFPVDAATVATVASGAWSNPAIWGGKVPRASDTAIVSPGTVVVVDVSVEVDTLIVNGLLRVLRPVTVRFGDALVDGGRLEAVGRPVRVTWTKLVADAVPGATALTVADDVSDWPQGQIVIAGARALYHDPAACAGSFGDVGAFNISCVAPAAFTSETARVLAVAGKQLSLAGPVAHFHPGTLPRQTEVGLLTRSIVFASIGTRRGHLKVMNGGSALLRHVEFARLGRFGVGTYPVHFHQLGSAGGQSLVDGISVWGSENLGIRIHATNFLTVARSVVYDVVGHGISTEDGTEVFNTIQRNLVVKTTFVPDGFDPRFNVNRNPNDASDRNEGSGYWISNGRNRLIGNAAADSQGWGFAIEPPLKKIAALANADGTPGPAVAVSRVPLSEFRDNESHGSWYGGFNILNLQAPAGEDSQIVGLHVWEAANFTIYQETTGLVSWVNPRTHEHSQFDVFPYRGGQTRFIGLEADVLTYTARRVWGWSVVRQARLNRIELPGAAPVQPITIVVDGYPGPARIGFDPGRGFGDPSQAELTSSVEVYLLDYDGPGQHVKLVHEDTEPFDTLTYDFSVHFGYAKETRFTDLTWPEIALPLRIDAGATADTVLWNGTRWRADQLYMGTPIGYRTPRFGTTGRSAAAAGDGSLVGSYRYGGSFGYAVDLPAGTYTVTLTFAEPSEKATAGSRVFDVLAEGVKVLDAVDVFAKTGAARVPLTRTTVVSVTDGQLNLTLAGRNRQAAVLSALVIDRW